ncbi:MAG: HAD-IA family hydrolase [Clostridiales bacterium]|nr:HAD-IA family hydrolase [Clostridiales bacterium]
MKYKLVIFDLDGTLLETGHDLASAVNRALSYNGLPELTEQKVFEYIGNGSLKLIERAVGGAETDIDKVHSDYKRFYLEGCTDTTVPFPGIVELLKALRRAGVKIAVNTNKPEPAALKVLDHCLPGLLDLIVAQNDTIPRKPDPTGALKAIGDFGYKPEECCYVGDSDVDINTARNAGIDCISVDWGFKTHSYLIEQGAALICSNTEELERSL